jgi:hypothetical protein
MDADSQMKDQVARELAQTLEDPLLIGGCAFFVGLVMGSRRWAWLGRESSQLARSLGALALSYAVMAFEAKNTTFLRRKVELMH